jgi:SAM-dependent methyltransferase
MTPSWDDYYRATAGRAPRELFLRLLDLVRTHGAPGLLAVDLGCGDGTETARLLAEGYEVLAVDQEPKAIELLRSRADIRGSKHLTTRVEAFGTLVLPPCDLVYAGLSMFFCEPEAFPRFWSGVASSVRPGGWLAAHFLGTRDTWANGPGMTSHEEAQVHTLLTGFRIEHFAEVEHDRAAVSGPKHWHLFEVVARKHVAPDVGVPLPAPART